MKPFVNIKISRNDKVWITEMYQNIILMFQQQELHG